MQKSYKQLEKGLFQFVLLFGFMLMESSVLVAAITAPIPATGDTYIYELNPTTTHGSATEIQVEIDTPNKRKRGLVQWNLSTIPAGSTILTATIEIRVNSAPSTNDALININRVAEAWNEATATWNSFTTPGGTYGATIYGTIPVAKNTPGIKTSTDITALVQQWVNGTVNNYGVILRGSNNNRPVSFASKDGSVTPIPTLRVTYEPPICGGAETSLTAYNWKVISFPCNTGTNGISALLGNSLGTYGNASGQHWVMYEQIAYTGNNTTDMRKMLTTDTVVPGKGYWIISDQNSSAKVNTALPGLSKTSVSNKALLGITTGSSFDMIHPYSLPNSQTSKYTKVMLGNPFSQKFQLSDMYFMHNNIAYYPMGDTEIDPYVEKIVYAHDSANNGYIAIPPETPGFGDKIDPMLGFWLLIKPGDTSTNAMTYPFEK